MSRNKVVLYALLSLILAPTFLYCASSLLTHLLVPASNLFATHMRTESQQQPFTSAVIGPDSQSLTSGAVNLTLPSSDATGFDKTINKSNISQSESIIDTSLAVIVDNEYQEVYGLSLSKQQLEHLVKGIIALRDIISASSSISYNTGENAGEIDSSNLLQFGIGMMKVQKQVEANAHIDLLQFLMRMDREKLINLLSK